MMGRESAWKGHPCHSLRTTSYLLPAQALRAKVRDSGRQPQDSLQPSRLWDPRGGWLARLQLP